MVVANAVIKLMEFRRFGAPLAWASLVVVGAYLVTIGGGYLMLNSTSLRLIDDTAAVALLLGWLAASLRYPALRPRSRLWPAILACLGAFAVSTITSWNQRLSVEMFSYAVLLALLYLLLVRLMASPFIRARIGVLAGSLAFVVCLLYLWQVATLWSQWWALVGHITVPPLRPADAGLALGSPNIVAALVLTLGTAGLTDLPRGSRPRVLILVGFLCLISLVVAVSGSRGAWLGMTSGVLTVAVVWILQRDNRRLLLDSMGSVSRPMRSVAVAAGATALALTLYLVRNRLSLADNGLRETFALVSMRLFAASPATGSGPGTWSVRRAVFTNPDELNFWNPHAQSIYTQTLAEFGVVGIVAAVIVVAAVAWLLRDAMRSGDGQIRRMGYAGLFIVCALGVQQTVDFFVNLPAVLFAAALPVAFLDAAGNAAPPWARWSIRVTGRPAIALLTATVAVVGVIGVGLWRVESAAALADEGTRLASDGDWGAAVPLFRSAAHVDPNLGFYWYQLGVASANAGDDQTALTALRRSTEQDQYAPAWIDLALLEMRAGNTTTAAHDLAQGERLGWQDADAMVAAAQVQYALGASSQALRDAAFAIVDAPSLASKHAGWRAVLPSVPMQALVDQALADLEHMRAYRTPSTVDRTRAAIGVFSDTPSLVESAAARLRAEGVRPSSVEVLILAQQALAGDPGAQSAMVHEAAASPTDPTVAGWTAVVAALGGATGEADLYRRQAVITEPFSATEEAWAYSITPWTATPMRHAAPTGQYPSAYRRPGFNSPTVWPLHVLQQLP